MYKALMIMSAVAIALSGGQAYACGGGSCEPPKPPHKVLLACDGGCHPPKPPAKVLLV